MGGRTRDYYRRTKIFNWVPRSNVTRGLTRLYVFKVSEPGCIGNNALAGEYIIISTISSRPRRHPDRPDTVWITKRDNAKACEHSNASVCAFSLHHHIAQRSENILLVDTEFSRFLQIIGKNIEQKLRVAIGIDVSVGISVKESPQLNGVDQVSILGLKRGRLWVKNKDDPG